MRTPPIWSRDARGHPRSPRHRQAANVSTFVEFTSRRGRPRSRSRQRGQSIVEFALILPLMTLILFAIIDFGRIYTTMMTVESAAREGADYATTLGAAQWDPLVEKDLTVAEMERRSCIAAGNLPDYVGDDPTGTVVTCSNPSFAYCLTTTPGGPCLPFDETAHCENPDRDPPCLVTVTLTYDFHLLAPVIGLPATITFDRDSTFAMTDIVAPTPPGP
jgi:Flp pilus assembly protein TadG